MVPGSTPSKSRAPTPARAFATVFLAVFIVIFVGSGVITFLLPERFVGVARVGGVDNEQLETFQSPLTLASVGRQLDLPRRFARQYGESVPLTEERTADMLRRALQVRRGRGTSTAEICVYSYSPDEAARLANAVAQAGISNATKITTASGRPELIDRAVPSSKPARPNKALNLTLGAIVGAFLGLMAGGVGARLAIGPPRARTEDTGG